MKVLRAKTAGFCMGVSLALQKLDKEIQSAASAIATLGPIIHNPQVLGHYEAKGVRCLAEPEQARSDERVVIRAHGVPRHTEDTLKSSAHKVVDATCPKVKRAQLSIARQISSGCTLLLYGEADHPEVRGLISYAGPDAFVFGSLKELESYPFDNNRSYCLAAQTTQDREEFIRIVHWLKHRLKIDIPVLETICDATRERQQEAIGIAKEVDIMVVVGGYTSGNTRRLADVSRAQGCETVHIEHPDELDTDIFCHKHIAGLTAGASTPKHIIDDTQKLLEAL